MALISWLSGRSRGSLIPLSLGFYLIAMSLLFISINISSAYSVKKELTNLGEAAINKAAHSINIPAYYAQLNQLSGTKSVPLDCNEAGKTFDDLIRKSSIHGKSVSVERFDCNLFDLSATISISARFPLDIPFFNLEQFKTFDIRTVIGASSVYIPN